MLNLTRNIGQKVYIYPAEGTENMTVEEFFAGGQVCIELLGVKGTQAKLAFDANENLVIVREELS